jgi:hypothetical protein
MALNPSVIERSSSAMSIFGRFISGFGMAFSFGQDC